MPSMRHAGYFTSRTQTVTNFSGWTFNRNDNPYGTKISSSFSGYATGIGKFYNSFSHVMQRVRVIENFTIPTTVGLGSVQMRIGGRYFNTLDTSFLYEVWQSSIDLSGVNSGNFETYAAHFDTLLTSLSIPTATNPSGTITVDIPLSLIAPFSGGTMSLIHVVGLERTGSGNGTNASTVESSFSQNAISFLFNYLF